MDRTAISYVNYIRNQIYINGIDQTYKNQYADMTYDITTDVQSIKNYLGIDSTLQRAAFESFTDLTDYYLIIDDSWFLKDQTVIEVTDIYFSDISDTTRYDGSMMLFSLNDLIYDYTKQDSSAILHFKFKINHYPDVTEHSVFTFPLFIKPSMDWIANDLIVQYDINFVSINFFTPHSLLMMLKTYIQSQYTNNLSENLKLNFIGWNNVKFIDYRAMIRSMILDNLTRSIGKEQSSLRDDMQKFYFHDFTTMVKMVDPIDVNKIIDLFTNIITDYYTNHTDWTIDPYAGFSTDRDLYELVWDKDRLTQDGTEFYDMLNINFLRFVLIRNNVYSWKFTLLQDGTEFWTDYIKFRVKNIIPNWTYDFSFTVNEFNVDLTNDHTSDLPLKIDILEYSNNLVWAGDKPYSRFINEYYFGEFTLKFKGNKNTIDYGFNNMRLFLSDSLSEEYKDIRYTFVYAPQDVISTKIAKIRFEPRYTDITNTWNVEKLLPLHDDFTSYYDLTAKFDTNSPDEWMQIQVPVQYELIYSKDVPISITLDTTDSTGNILPAFEYLDQDTTEQNVTITPTLDITSLNKTFMVMFRYKFNRDVLYTDEVIQKLNNLIHARITSDNVDNTDVNYFQEFIDVHFVTTKFKLRPTSHTPVQAAAYNEADAVVFKPTFSTVTNFRLYSWHELKDVVEHGNEASGACNFSFTGGGEGTREAGEASTRGVIFNRTCTIKSVPITVEVSASSGFSVADGRYADQFTAQDGTTTQTYGSPTLGNVKEMNNFGKDMIVKTIADKFNRQTIDELFNWYMSHINNDIQITYRQDMLRTHYSVEYKSDFLDEMLSSGDEYNSWATIKWLFNHLGLDHTSANKYSDKDLAIADSHMYEEQSMGSYSYTMLTTKMDYRYQLDINFASSEIYDLSKLPNIMFEAWIAKYHPEQLPSGWRFSKYGDPGVIATNGKYTYGEHFRLGFFGGNSIYVDRSSGYFPWVATQKGYGRYAIMGSVLGEWFCKNYEIDFTTPSGELVVGTPEDIITLYFSDLHDRTDVLDQVIGMMYSQLVRAFTGIIKVKRIYSADLTATLENLTEDIFTIHIEPTLLSPFYSNFKISDIKFIYDKGTVSITELFDRNALMSKRFNTCDLLGTGLDFMCKYLNRSFMEVPVSVMIYYLDEFGYEKTISVNLVLKSKIQTFVQSQTSYVLKWGVNILKAIQLLSVFDQQTEGIVDTENCLKASVGELLNADGATASQNAKGFWGGLFGMKDKYNSIFKQYLPPEVLDTFYYEYLENRLYGRPHFNQSSSVSMFVKPENVEILDPSDVTLNVALDAINFLCDSTYGTSQAQGKVGWGDLLNPFIDYRIVIDNYYNLYHDRRGYDINLILLPDTTYTIALKTYLVYEWTLTAAEKAMRTLSGFLSGIGGGSEGACLLNLREFLTLARMYPNYNDLVHGILRDMYISKNFPRYGRLPSAQHPIKVEQYLPNQWEAEYNQLIETGNFYYYETDKMNRAQFGFVVPFEKIVLSVDTTSTGIFDCNFTHFGGTELKTEFGYFDEMRGSNFGIKKFKEKITVQVQIPSLIPKKYIDVIVKPLF